MHQPLDTSAQTPSLAALLDHAEAVMTADLASPRFESSLRALTLAGVDGMALLRRCLLQSRGAVRAQRVSGALLDAAFEVSRRDPDGAAFSFQLALSSLRARGLDGAPAVAPAHAA